MKFLFFICTFFIISISCAQTNIYRKTLQSPDEHIAELVDQEVLINLKEDLFENSQELKILETERAQKKEKVFQEKLSWLSSFNLGLQFFNYSQDLQTDYVQIGVLSNLGGSLKIDLYGLSTLGSRIRSAKGDVIKSEYMIQVQRLELSKWMDVQYLNYVEVIEALKIQINEMNSLEAQAKLTKEKFELGQSDLDEYLMIEGAVNQAKLGILKNKITAEKIYREILQKITSVKD
ncbi:TolC family protein [Flexithrix dorotheae]|uniref:TolC family protein n=1 Tax=Flexithrix dorotheae TaxID=70993 RepID=UPI00036B241D|nr:TolC family protein [Flexithrix dorotheae]